ncbi:50S ribosomal protein L14e [Candidatus Woesearchaeota archaeon]|nr:50S ribosomal protein L14e [Candidatus Woesearchaeota archaeon]
MVEVGDVAVKIAGRDAGQICAVVDVLDGKYVLVDGSTRRKKCNMSHLEFLDKKIKIKKGAETSDVRRSLSDAGFKILDVKKVKRKEGKEKPTKLRKTKKSETAVEKKTLKKKE